MTPAARVQTAIELLDEILDGAPAEKALTGWARRSRFAGSKDRAAVRDHVYDALRRRNSAAALGGGLTGRGLMIGVLRQDGAELPVLFNGQSYAPAPLSETEQAPVDRAEVVDLPDWMIPHFEQGLGANYAQSLACLSARAPVALRVNLRKTNLQAARAALKAEGIETRPTEAAGTALIVEEGARRVAQSEAFRTGLVELQDASSQAAVEALPLRDGQRVLDYCAGGGGKVLAMAARVQARFFAHDVNAQRMRDLPKRAARAGVRITLTEAPEDQGPYDLVFCDVPCSGSGTWRRTPDAKWRFEKADLEDLVKVQAAILAQAAPMVAPGGVLAYATCSVFPEENTAQIERFLTAFPEWTRMSAAQLPISPEGDGFFYAFLTR